MRRVIAATSNFADVGDIATLANPEIVEQSGTGAEREARARRGAARATEAEEAEIKPFGSE